MNVAGFLRWALTKPVIIALVIVAGIAGGAIGWKSTTSHFESTAAVLVIPPGAGSTNAKDNPFTDLGYGAAQVAQVLTVVAQGPRGRAALEKVGASPDVTMIASVGDGNPKQISPLITFTVSAPEARQAEDGAKALIEFWRAEFKRMQVDAGVVGNTFADLRVPVAPTSGTEVGGNPMRAALGLAMGSALAMLALSLVVAAVLEALRNRRAKAVASTPGAAAADAPTTQTPVEAEAPAAESSVLSGIVPVAPEVGDAPSRTVPAAIPIRPPGDAARRAMTRWRDRVEEVSEDGEIPLPELDDTATPAPGAASSEVQDPRTAATSAGATSAADDTEDDDLELPRVQSAR
ncbi:hypothetical protein [Tsukamurella hominis]|uniref:hypothetical protein n=1 Tax=Tsukamurella hominis TaxID=1970232 RepID=UPI0039E95885